MKHSALALIVGTFGFAVACGSSSGNSGFSDNSDLADGGGSGNGEGGPVTGFGGGDSSTTKVTITPSQAIVIIDTATTPATPGTQAFTVASASGSDITSSATFTLDDTSLGAFNGATFTSVGALPTGVLGKSGIVTANTSQGQALGSLTVVALRKTGSDRDFFFIEPYQGTPTPATDTLAFSTNIQNVDVAFVMDTTGSMSDEISGLTSALSGNLLSQLQAAIPSVGMAIISHKDVVDGPGKTGLCGVYTPITTTLATAQSAISAIGSAGATGGGDEPEGMVACMDYVLNGKALVCASSDNGACSAGTTLETAVANSAAGNFGAAQFRPGAVPVVVEITDASWHDPSAGISLTQLGTDFKTANARFIGIETNDGLTTADGAVANFEVQANNLSDATGSNLPPTAIGGTAGNCPTGINNANRGPIGGTGTNAANCRLNYVFQNGGALGATFTNNIANAIKGIAIGSQFDVTTKPVNDPANAGGVDATKFIKELRAMDEGDPTNNCPPHAAIDTNGDGIKDTFTAVVVGTPVCFQVIPAVNTFVPATKDPQFFDANINVIGVQGSVQLDQRKVTFLVPPTAPGVN